MINETNLTSFYDDLKKNLNNNEVPEKNLFNVKMGLGGFNNSPNAMAWRNKAIKCKNKLEDDCHKHILLDIYCKILPLDNDFIDGNRGIINQDIDNMLANKNMTATQYMKSCYESTKAPLLEFILRSVNNIGKCYMEEADEIIKDAQDNDELVQDPKEPSTEDEVVKSQIVDITNDTEYENFVDELKKKTINKIVDDVSKIINDKKDENDMKFDTTPVSDMEEKLESTTSIALNYIHKGLMKENVEITPEMNNDIIGMAIRESVINQFDVVFRQPTGEFNKFANRIRVGNGIVVNKSTLNYLIY